MIAERRINVRELHAGDMSAARTLLVAADLPVDDLADPAITLLGAFDRDSLVGVIGLQTIGTVGLLRSLATAPEQRSRGIARTLCERVFELTADRGLTSLWLLATTAADYFTRFGFEPVARELAPTEIRATAQFTSLCPASAIVMRRA